MSTKDYFSNLQNRYSANFIAMASFISLVYAIVFHTIDYLPRHLKWGYNLYGWDFPSSYWFISTAVLGFIVLFVIFPLSIPFYLFLKNKDNRKNFLYIISFILLCIILCIIFRDYSGLTDIATVLSIVATYFHMYKILLPIFIFIPILCIADFHKNLLVSNTNITNNKIYKYCIYFFFYYFWFQYITFVPGLLFCVYIDLH